MAFKVCAELYAATETVAEKKELLQMVNQAMKQLLLGGVQSYTIGKRALTRLNLSELRALKKQLTDEIADAESPAYLMGNTGVSYFDRR